jgi:hypothetical protein
MQCPYVGEPNGSVCSATCWNTQASEGDRCCDRPHVYGRRPQRRGPVELPTWTTPIFCLSALKRSSTEPFAFLFATFMFSYRVSAFIRPARVLKRHLATQSDGAFSIPIIDFSKFRTAASPEEKKKTAGEIVSAFKSAGFVYLTNHGITLGEREMSSIPFNHSFIIYHLHRRDQKCVHQGGYLNTLPRARLTV